MSAGKFTALEVRHITHIGDETTHRRAVCQAQLGFAPQLPWLPRYDYAEHLPCKGRWGFSPWHCGGKPISSSIRALNLARDLRARLPSNPIVHCRLRRTPL